MPRNNSGIYTLPPLNPVVPFTVIATQWANTTLPDIAAALSDSVSASGTTTVLANLPMNGFRHTGVGQALTATQYTRADQSQFFTFNIVTSPTVDVGRTAYAGTLPFGIGSTVTPSYLMPILFVPPQANAGPSTLALNTGTASPILTSDGAPLVANQLKAGRPVALVFVNGNWVLVTNVLDITTLDQLYVRLNGSVMTGPLILYADTPIDNREAASRGWVISQITGSIGGVASFNTRTGAVVLNSLDVTNALGFTPFNAAGGTISGGVTVNSQVNSLSMETYVYYANIVANSAVTGTLALNFNNCQVQSLALTGPVTLTLATAGWPIGNIGRLIITNTTANPVTWPANVLWPMPIQTAPDLTTGANKKALVTLCWDGTNWLANASVY
jgi:hypothetical protein